MRCGTWRTGLGGMKAAWAAVSIVMGVLAVGAVVKRNVVGAAPEDPKLNANESAHHVLVRLAFGPRPGEYKTVAKEGWQKWVESQLDPASIDDSKLDERITKECPSVRRTLSELEGLSRESDRDTERESRDRIKNELRKAVLLRAVHSERQLQEVIVDFWRNHFNVDVNKVPYLATHYEENVLRTHAFGKFDDLLMATARHPAMLVYLDNYVSNRNGLNENYARELMELHSLGVDNGYKQQDVINLAKVLTGWTCGWRPAENASAGNETEYKFFFNEGAHDPTPVTVVGLDIGGQGGIADGEAAIRHLALHNNTSRFIAAKLCRYLVRDNPDPAFVERVSSVFRKTEGDLKAVYRAIILDPEFMKSSNFRCKVRTPFEFIVSALRMTDARIESPDRIFRELQLMGQPLYECLEPTGYSDAQEAWLDPGVMVYRWNFSIELVTGKVKGVSGGMEFVEPILKAPADSRPRKVMEMLLPGVTDPKLEKLLTFTPDPRAITAFALGSPSFQQQ